MSQTAKTGSNKLLLTYLYMSMVRLFVLRFFQMQRWGNFQPITSL